MKKNYIIPMVRRSILCLWLVAAVFILNGCTAANTSQTKEEIWLVTERSTWDRMNGQLYVLGSAFEEQYPNANIRVDYLPTAEQEREVYLQQLRTEILQGGGPDAYLLPTDNTLILDEPTQYVYVEVEPLFVDVDLAMRGGLFYDITGLYDTDDALDKEGLNTTIMDAGVVDGIRYVLPLRYDIPVIYAKEGALVKAGLDSTILSEDIDTIMQKILKTGDPILAAGVLQDSYSAFSDFVNYDSGNIVLQENELHQYLYTYQQLQSLLGANILDHARIEDESQLMNLITEQSLLLEALDLKKYIYAQYGVQEEVEVPDNVYFVGGQLIEEEGPDVLTEYFPLYIGSMSDALSYAAVAKYEESQLTIVPMHSVGGDVIATVTYYAAIGSGCRNPELTYAFLRQFLLEESQWEMNRPERNHTQPFKGAASNTSNDLQYPGLIEKGWPVRAKGSVQSLWQKRRTQIYVRQLGFGVSETARQRMRKIGLMSELEEERIPLMDIQINQVRFNTSLSENFAETLARLNDRNNENKPTDVDLRELSQKLLWNIRWHVSEG